MSQERLEILRMLSEGKINAREAEMLLRALSDTSDGDERSDPKAQRSKEVTEIFQEVGQEVSKAVESARRSDVGKIVSQVVSDVVEEVKASVADVMGETEKTDQTSKVEEQLDWSFDGAGISKLDAQTVNGSISLTASDHGQVIVHAWKVVRASHAADAEELLRKVQVNAEQHENEIRIYSEYPKPPKGVNVTVRYEIECPRFVDVNLRTVNDRIGISGIEGAIDVTTVNGVIKLQGDTGPIHARTTNGNIDVSVGRLQYEAGCSTTNGSIDMKIDDGIAPVKAATTNGSINVMLPADFSGQLNAKTSTGRVHSDFPIPVIGKIKNRLEGQIGEGGETLVKLRSLNGSIHVRRSP